MNIKTEIQKVLDESGWSPSRLAAEAGVAPPLITRFLSGKRDGIHSTTLEKLWPFVFGDERPKPQAEKGEADSNS